MIKRVQVKNFRNFKEFSFNIPSNRTVIAGENGIGKSNLLNAIYVFFNGSILTDNYGVAENELDSIVPINQNKGDGHTEISLTLDDGNVYTKVYKVGYDKKTGKPNTHTWEYQINGVKYKASDFEKMLNKALNYTPNLIGVDETKLWTDPLYLLVKFPNEPKGMKKLRDFLEHNLDCKITNQEVYDSNPKFEQLKLYESKYFGNFDTMASDYAKKIKELDGQITLEQAKYDDIKDAVLHSVVLDELETEKGKLLNDKSLITSDTNSKINELCLDLKGLELERESVLKNFENQKQAKIQALESEKRMASVFTEKHIEIEDIKNKKIPLVNKELENLEFALQQYQKAYATCEGQMKFYQKEMQIFNDQLIELRKQYSIVYNRKLEDYITCPHCGGMFVDEKANALFEETKKRDLDNINNNGKQTSTNHSNAKKNFEFYSNQLNEAQEQILDVKARQSNEEHKLTQYKERLQVLEADTSNPEVEALEKEITNVKNAKINTDELDAKIRDLKALISSLQIKDDEVIKTQLEAINIKLVNLDIKIKAEQELESNYQKKLKINKFIQELIKQKNDLDYVYELVNSFNQTKIRLLNEKVKNKTGIDFVMLEESLTTDSVKEVCYPIVNGVEFKHLNTAEKYIVGVHIIEKIKKMLGVEHKLPILMDKLEGIDNENLDRYLEDIDSQLICTKVKSTTYTPVYDTDEDGSQVIFGQEIVDDYSEIRIEKL